MPASVPIVLRTLLTVEQTANVLNVGKSTVRRWIANRTVDAVRFGRSIRVPQNEIARLVDEHTIPKCETSGRRKAA